MKLHIIDRAMSEADALEEIKNAGLKPADYEDLKKYVQSRERHQHQHDVVVLGTHSGAWQAVPCIRYIAGIAGGYETRWIVVPIEFKKGTAFLVK